MAARSGMMRPEAVLRSGMTAAGGALTVAAAFTSTFSAGANTVGRTPLAWKLATRDAGCTGTYGRRGWLSGGSTDELGLTAGVLGRLFDVTGCAGGGDWLRRHSGGAQKHGQPDAGKPLTQTENL